MQMLRTRVAAGVAAALLAGLAGCSGNKTAKSVAEMNTSNIQRLSNLYGAFQTNKVGVGPKDEAEFREFIKAFDPEKLSWMSVDPNNLDALFTSERDGKPFKIRWKVPGGRGAVGAVVFESQGKDGSKQVGFTGPSPRVDEVSDDGTYQKLLAGKGESQGPAGPPTGTPGGARPGQGSRPGGGAPPGAPTGPPK